MKNPAILLIILIIASVAPFSYSRGTDDPNDYHLRFGIVEIDKAGNRFLSKETAVIPLKLKETGFKFGFEITPPNRNPYTFQYIVHFPSPPDRLSGGFVGINPTKPSTTATSPKRKVPEGTVTHFLSFDPGDPVGEYTIEVFINETLFKTITFNVRSE